MLSLLGWLNILAHMMLLLPSQAGQSFGASLELAATTEALSSMESASARLTAVASSLDQPFERGSCGQP